MELSQLNSIEWTKYYISGIQYSKDYTYIDFVLCELDNGREIYYKLHFDYCLIISVSLVCVSSCRIKQLAICNSKERDYKYDIDVIVGNESSNVIKLSCFDFNFQRLRR